MTFMSSYNFSCPECDHINTFPVVASFNWMSEPSIHEICYGVCWGCGHVWFMNQHAGYTIKEACKISDYITWKCQTMKRLNCDTWEECVEKLKAKEDEKNDGR